jgi:hypothetical protein
MVASIQCMKYLQVNHEIAQIPYNFANMCALFVELVIKHEGTCQHKHEDLELTWINKQGGLPKTLQPLTCKVVKTM